MTNELRADVERLNAKAGEFGPLAERAGTIAAELRENLDALGDCWGGDEVGRSFAAAHADPAAAVLDALGSLGARLDEMGAKLTDAAGRFDAADTQAATDLGAGGGK